LAVIGTSEGGGAGELEVLLVVESFKRVSEEAIVGAVTLVGEAPCGFVFAGMDPPAFCTAAFGRPDVGVPVVGVPVVGVPVVGCPEFGRDDGLFAGWELLALGPNCRYAMTKLARSTGMIVVSC
jgi:hypothetical protein